VPNLLEMVLKSAFRPAILMVVIGSAVVHYIKVSIGAEAIKRGEIPDPYGYHKLFGIPDQYSCLRAYKDRLRSGHPAALAARRYSKWVGYAALAVVAAVAVEQFAWR